MGRTEAVLVSGVEVACKGGWCSCACGRPCADALERAYRATERRAAKVLRGRGLRVMGLRTLTPGALSMLVAWLEGRSKRVPCGLIEVGS